MFCMTYGLESVRIGVDVKDDSREEGEIDDTSPNRDITCFSKENPPHELYNIQPIIEIICTYYPFLRFAPWNVLSKNRVSSGKEIDDILSNLNDDSKVLLSVLHTPLIMPEEEVTFHSFMKTFSSQYYYRAMDMDTPDLYCSICSHEGVVREAKRCHEEKGDGEWLYSFIFSMRDTIAIDMVSFLPQCRVTTFEKITRGDFKWNDGIGLSVMQILDVKKVRIMCKRMGPELRRTVFGFFIYAHFNMIENEGVREIVNMMLDVGIKISFSLEHMYSKESALLLKKLEPDSYQIMTLATGVCNRLDRGNEVSEELISSTKDLCGKLALKACEKYMSIINKYRESKK